MATCSLNAVQTERDGDSYLREYDGNTHRWTHIGRYVQGMDASPNACAYINRMDYDVLGRLHVSWCWRDDFGGGSNHDRIRVQ